MDDAKRKQRFHEVMAEHYAHGGDVGQGPITFGNEDFLSAEGDENMKEGPEEAAAPKVEDGMDAKRKRLHSIRMGK